jgi:hypothetical protein
MNKANFKYSAIQEKISIVYVHAINYYYLIWKGLWDSPILHPRLLLMHLLVIDEALTTPKTLRTSLLIAFTNN